MRSLSCCCALALAAWTGVVQAQPLLAIEVDMAVPVVVSSDGAQPQLALFSPGAVASAAMMFALVDSVLVGARLRSGFLLDGQDPSDRGREDPGLGTLSTLTGFVRLHPFAGGAGRRTVGLFMETGGGAALTGALTRATLEAGLGYGLRAGSLKLSPSVRFVQVIQPSGNLDEHDARLLLFGLELVALDVAPPPRAKPSRGPSDLDGDGLLDPDDACPLEPEDFDGFQDEDGCPEPDNDGDGIEDSLDRCPLEPEDKDGFEDQDGCPDPDNDQDGIPDTLDACPDQPEVINGVQDQDGCPDEGLIKMVDDRIVLQERVLFDFSRARVKKEAVPIVEAIVELVRQHPEWTSVRIEGHTDIHGKERFNQWLSERRAKNVRLELIAHGVPAGILQAEGFGESRVLDPGRYPEAHQRNRRVEFVVVKRRQLPSAGVPVLPPPAPTTKAPAPATDPAPTPPASDTGSTSVPLPAPGAQPASAPPSQQAPSPGSKPAAGMAATPQVSSPLARAQSASASVAAPSPAPNPTPRSEPPPPPGPQPAPRAESQPKAEPPAAAQGETLAEDEVNW